MSRRSWTPIGVSRWAHFVRVTHLDSLMLTKKPYPAVAAVRHTFPVRGKACPDHLRTAEVGTSDQRNHGVVGAGGAVRPLYPLLVRAKPSVHRSDDRTGLRRSKDFRLSQGSRLSTAPCSGRHSLDPVTRGSTGVSVRRVSAVPHSQGVTGRSGAIY
jgi:hypothetical protein